MEDVIVVGAGPAGLTAALVCARQQRNVLVVDSGKPRNAAAAHSHMLITRDGMPPHLLRQAARAELAQYSTARYVESEVLSASGVDGGWDVELPGSTVRASKLILATGQIDVLPRIPGLAQRFGRCVFHCPYCHGYEAKGQSLAVLGDGYVHAMQAVYLADRFSPAITLLSHGRPLEAKLRDLLARRGVQVEESEILSIDGDIGDVSLSLSSGKVLHFGAMFHRTATRQRSDLAEMLGCSFLPDGRVKVNAVQQTSVAGVFAIGDMARQEAQDEATSFIVTGAADGLRAAIWADQELLSDRLDPRP